MLAWWARRIQPFWGSGPEELRAATLFLAITERRRISHSDSTSLGPKNCSGYDYTQIWWVIPTIVRLQIRGHSSHWWTLGSIWRSSSSPARPSERRGAGGVGPAPGYVRAPLFLNTTANQPSPFSSETKMRKLRPKV